MFLRFHDVGVLQNLLSAGSRARRKRTGEQRAEERAGIRFRVEDSALGRAARHQAGTRAVQPRPLHLTLVDHSCA